MSKLWIVHRRPPVRAALARATGLSAARIRAGGPALAEFPAEAPAPDAILVGFDADDDGAAERAFAAAASTRAPEAQWIAFCPPGQSATTRHRLRPLDPVVLELPLDRARLRVELAAAFARAAARLGTRAHAAAELDPVAEREAARFAAWFGTAPLAGSTRAFDPALGDLPLLVRGVPGSGRALFLDVAERARARARGRFPFDRTLFVDGRDPNALTGLGERLRAERERAGAAKTTVRIRGLEALAPHDQALLADWIAGEAIAARWLATAGPAGLDDRLEESLARVFVPLTVRLPSLDTVSDAIPRLAAWAAREWAERTGDPAKRFSHEALDALAEQPWWGDRAELVAALRETLAHAGADEIRADELRFPDAVDLISAPAATGATEPGYSPSASDLAAQMLSGTLELDPNADPSSELGALTERWRSAGPPPATMLDPRAAHPSPNAATAADAGSTTPGPRPSAPPAWRRLARSLAHEIRNPLVSIRTFTELLPDHWSDETFRTRFKELVGKDVRHIQDVVAQLARAAERERLALAPVDVSALIDRLLAARRERIARRRLVVLSELERDRPTALADADALSAALAGLVDRALDALPDRGDLFVTTRHVARAADGRPCLRLLLRHHNPQASGLSGELDPVNHILEYVLAETLVTAQGGRMTLDPTLGPETLVVIDLPTA